VKDKWTAVVYKAGAVAAVLALLLFFAPYFLAILSFGFEGLTAKWAMDNPYVDRNLWGWQEMRIQGFDPFEIPGDWSPEAWENGYRVCDASGQVLGYVTLFGNDDPCFDSWEAFFTAFLGFEAVEGSRAHAAGIPATDTSYYCEITLADREEPVLCCLLLYDRATNHYILMAFPSDGEEEVRELREILTAVAYSYDYS
jgi:hypothetical protein